MTSKHTLKNGITVLLHNLPKPHLAAVFVGVNIGSNHENDNEHGLAHFFEHMCFKGTKSYPTHELLSGKIDSSGLQSNAFTGNDITAYHLSGLNEHLNKMIDLTSEIFLNSLFPSEELEKEKSVIQEEIKMYEDDPGSKLWETIDKELFQGTPLDHDILGTPESVRSFTRESFIDFFEKHYVTGNTIISIVGNFDEEEILKKLEGLYSGAKHGENTPQRDIEPNAIKNSHISIVRKENQQMLAGVGFRAPELKTELFFPALLLKIILGGGMSSRLFLNLRENKGLCYSVSASYSANTNHGDFKIITGVSNKNLELAIKEIANECSRIKRDLVSEEELKKAKNVYITSMLTRYETSRSIASTDIRMFALVKDLMNTNQTIENINKVTIEDVQKAAQTILDGENFVACYVGPLDVPETINEPLKKI